MRRPALVTGLFFALGILTAYSVDIPIFYLFFSLVGLAATCTIALILRKSENLPVGVAFFTMLLLSGAFRYELATGYPPTNHFSGVDWFGENIVLEGQVVKEPEVFDNKTRITVRAKSVLTPGGGMLRLSDKVLVVVKGQAQWVDYGDKIRAYGRLHEPQGARNPGGFDYRSYLFRRGIHGMVFVPHPLRIEVLGDRADGHGLYDLFMSNVVLPVRKSIRRSIGRNLSGEPEALLKGILLGERRALSKGLQSAFATAGVIHVLAVSGLHTALVVLIFFTTLKLLRLSDGWTVLVTVLLLILYAFITDLRPSVIRASIMAGLVLIGLILERDSDVINNIGLAALVILLIWPQSLFDLGFQLTFAAALSIILLYRPINSLLRNLTGEIHWGRWILAALAVSIAAQLGTAPVIAFHFNRFVPISLVANIVVVPTIGIILTLGFLTSIFGFWLVPVATIFNAANWFFLKLLIKMVHLFAGVSYGWFWVPSPSNWFLIGYFSFLILVTQSPRSINVRKALIYLVLIISNIYLWRGILYRSGRLEVVFLDVGQGDGVFINFPNGRKMLVDGGPRNPYFDAGEAVVSRFLHHRGIRKLDVVVATHPDVEHIGGLISVLENFQVDNLLDNGQPYDSWTTDRLYRVVRAKGIRRWTVSAGDSLVGLGAGAVVLGPNPGFISAAGKQPLYGVDNGSIVLKFDYGGVSFLLTGDAEGRSERALMAWGSRLNSTVLKAGHHGAGGSSGLDFLRRVGPEIVVISVGRGNRYGYPSGETLERFRQVKAVVYRTDRHGAITVTVDNKGWKVSKMF